MGDGAFQLLSSAGPRSTAGSGSAAAGAEDAWSDAALLRKIREVLAASPFYGEGHRKVWARLRFQQVRTSKARVLRLMREAQLLAPSRTLPKPENPHTGTILTDRPNEVWASDHTLTATIEEGQVTVFVAVDHCTTECVGDSLPSSQVTQC
jgi:putative transposase